MAGQQRVAGPTNVRVEIQRDFGGPNQRSQVFVKTLSTVNEPVEVGRFEAKSPGEFRGPICPRSERKKNEGASGGIREGERLGPVASPRDTPIPKAEPDDYEARFREIVSDPHNDLIERVAEAGVVEDGMVTLHNGVRVPLAGPGSYYGPFSRILTINRGVHEPLEEFIFQELLRVLPDAPVMLELGAYWAHYSLWLKLRRPAARAIMIEPDTASLNAGVSNFKRANVKGEFVQAAVGSGRGRIQLDGYLKYRNLKRLDVLHADIQGFEVEMLEGARGALAESAIDYLFISTHSQSLHTEVVERLGSAGYRVEVSSDFDHGTTAYDGFVFASSPRVGAVVPGLSPPSRETVCRWSENERKYYVTSVRGLAGRPREKAEG